VARHDGQVDRWVRSSVTLARSHGFGLLARSFPTSNPLAWRRLNVDEPTLRNEIVDPETPRSTRSSRPDDDFRVPPSPLRRVLSLAAFVILGLVMLTLGERLLYWGKVLPGVAVPAVRVAGKSEQAARLAVDNLASSLQHAALHARAAGHDLVLDRAAIDYRIDSLATIRAARRAGRKGTPLDQITGLALRRARNDEVALRVSYNRRKLDQVIADWARQVDNGLENGALQFKGTTVVAVPPKAGTGILRRETRQLVERSLRTGSTDVVDLPIGRVRPEVDTADVQKVASRARRVLAGPVTITVGQTLFTLTPDQLAGVLATRVDHGTLVLDVNRDDLHTALGPTLPPLETTPVDATFTVNPDNSVSVTPSVPGKLLDLDAIAGSIVAGERSIVGSLKDKDAEHNSAWAEKLHITQLVSTFTTKHPAGQPRVTNIHKAADTLNNTIVEPGQTFSLNDKLGQRTLDKGYVPAPAIAADLGLSDEVGGGVSQVSTTLFNAIFFGGYKVVEHTPHAYYIDRYPMGREATLNFPSIDNKFTNDSPNGILIRVGYTDTSITVSFYSTNDGRSVKAEGPNILERTPFVAEDVDSPFLYQGDAKEVQKGHDGLKVEVFRVISRPGQPDERERFFTNYAMVKQKTAHGTAPPTTTTVPGTPSSSTAPGTPPSSTPGTPTSAGPVTTLPATTLPATSAPK